MLYLDCLICKMDVIIMIPAWYDGCKDYRSNIMHSCLFICNMMDSRGPMWALKSSDV